MEQKTRLIKIGDFFFKYRNALFPVVLIVLFFSFETYDTYLGSHTLEMAKDMLAVLITLSGLALRAAVIGYRYIKRGGLNKKVYAKDLVTDGFFGVCRNPLYVGNFLIYGGVLLMHGAPAVFLLGMAFFAFVYTAIVAAEEYFLRNEFGQAYVEYCRDVPRWQFRFGRFRAATQGMQFNYRRALTRDYGTIANAVVCLTLLELLEQVEFYNDVAWLTFVSIIGATLVVGLSVRYAKKHGHLKVA